MSDAQVTLPFTPVAGLSILQVILKMERTESRAKELKTEIATLRSRMADLFYLNSEKDLEIKEA